MAQPYDVDKTKDSNHRGDEREHEQLLEQFTPEQIRAAEEGLKKLLPSGTLASPADIVKYLTARR